MSNALNQVAKSALPMSSDVNQTVGMWNGTADPGPLSPPGITSAPSSALTATLNGSGSLTGAYGYVVTYITGIKSDNGMVTVNGETLPSAASTSVTTSSQQISLTNIPVAPAPVIGRRIYRNKAGGSASTGPFYLLTQINDITTTTFPDNIADANLGAQAPSTNTTGTYFVESTLLGKREMLPDYDQYMSSADANDIYTVVTLKRPDGTTYMVSTLSNANGNGFYQTDTWQFYNAAGTSVIKTHVWSITYDANGRPTQKVMSS